MSVSVLPTPRAASCPGSPRQRWLNATGEATKVKKTTQREK
jgi:hypothetical protein